MEFVNFEADSEHREVCLDYLPPLVREDASKLEKVLCRS